jgi:hypothetical protein
VPKAPRRGEPGTTRISDDRTEVVELCRAAHAAAEPREIPLDTARRWTRQNVTVTPHRLRIRRRVRAIRAFRRSEPERDIPRADEPSKLHADSIGQVRHVNNVRAEHGPVSIRPTGHGRSDGFRHRTVSLRAAIQHIDADQVDLRPTDLPLRGIVIAKPHDDRPDLLSAPESRELAHQRVDVCRRAAEIAVDRAHRRGRVLESHDGHVLYTHAVLEQPKLHPREFVAAVRLLAEPDDARVRSQRVPVIQVARISGAIERLDRRRMRR